MNDLLGLIKSIQQRPTIYQASSPLAVFSPPKQNKSKKQRISRSSESQKTTRTQQTPRQTSQNTPQVTSQRTTRSQTSKKQAIDTFRKRVATKKIQKFMKKYESKRRALFLNSICSDAGVCIAFGKENDKIKKHFNGFVDFEYLTAVKKIGKPSNNGFVKEFTYEHEGYKSNAIFKSSMNPDADNLFFEYLVGQYINKLNNMYPCFLETYGLFQYKNETSWMLSATTDPRYANRWNPQSTLILQSENITNKSFENSCSSSQYLSILIQHIKNAKTIQSMLGNYSFTKRDLLYVLYQVYMPLANEKNAFTHYDLHLENVLLYEPVEGHYIEYHYHVGGEEITFKSSYIAKIIDYGRSFFDDKNNSNKDTNSSKHIYEKICTINNCYPRDENGKIIKDKYSCGQDVGYGSIGPEDPPGSFFYISGTKRNSSHDLRLLYLLKRRTGINDMYLKELLQKIQYGINVDQENKIYGTIENEKSGLPNKINNVVDARDALGQLIMSEPLQHTNQESYLSKEKLGELHIYDDGRPVEFVEHI